MPHNVTPQTPPAIAAQPRNPLHGITLEAIVTALVTHYSWKELGQRIPVRCFTSDPSVSSGLKFLHPTGRASRWKGCACSCCASSDASKAFKIHSTYRLISLDAVHKLL